MSDKPSWYPEVLFEDPEEPAYAPDGVDLTQIRWFLDLTPRDRLAYLEGWVRSIARLTRAVEGDRD